MKKILFVIGTLDNGGAERVVSLLASELQRMGYQVSIITIIDNTVFYDLDEDVKIVSMQFKGTGIKRNYYRIRDLRKEIKKNDVIISFLAIMNMATLCAAVGLHKAVILSERNDPAKEPGKQWARTVRNFMYRFFHCSHFVFQTKDAAGYFGRRLQKKSSIIPNPIIELPEPFHGTRRHNIVTIARMEPQKNLRLLLRCFANVNRKYGDYALDIYGRGPLQEELERYAGELGLADKVNFHGFVSNVHGEILDAGMYVMSSDYEGISNGMLEALGLGLPVIATDCPIGGARMFIKNDVNGVLVPVGDEEKLTQAMFKVIENRDYAKRIGSTATDIRKTLALKRIARLWSNVIEGNK